MQGEDIKKARRGCLPVDCVCVHNSWFITTEIVFDISVLLLLPLQNNNGSQKISGDQLKDLYKSFVSEYPIVSIEDPFDQDDWVHYSKITGEIGAQVQIVGDDLLVTNPKVMDPIP